MTAGIILAIMVLPFIAAVSRDVFETVPAVLKEAAYGLGATTREVVRKVVLPYSRVGVIGGAMLALGRALGETMAVTFVIGNDPKVRASLLAPGTTISSSIANEFAEAKEAMHSSALVALGLVLFVITLIVLAAARLMLQRMNKRKRELEHAVGQRHARGRCPQGASRPTRSSRDFATARPRSA